MAEIHVEPKKQAFPSWLWILISLIVVAAVIYFITQNNRAHENITNDTNETSYIQEHLPAGITYNAEAA